MDTHLKYLAWQAKVLYSTLLKLRGQHKRGGQYLAQLERLRPEVFDISRNLTNFFQHKKTVLERSRADKAQQIIIALHNQLLIGYRNALNTSQINLSTTAMLMQRIVRSVQESYFSGLLNGQDAPSGLWSLLHSTYGRASHLDIQLIPVDDPEAYESQTQTVNDALLHTLLVAGSQPLRIPTDALPLLLDLMRMLAPSVKVSPAAPGQGWVLASDEDSPFRDAPKEFITGSTALDLSGFLAVLERASLFAAVEASTSFDIKTYLLSIWRNAQEEWETCGGYSDLLAHLGATEIGSGLDARYFERQQQAQDVWINHSGGRRGLDEQVQNLEEITFRSAAYPRKLPPITLLKQVRVFGRDFIALWEGGGQFPPPKVHELLGVRPEKTAGWRLARVERIEVVNNQAQLTCTILSTATRVAKIALRTKTQQSDTCSALLIGEGNELKVICRSLPLQSGRKLLVKEQCHHFLALIGDYSDGAFTITTLELAPV